eukprot:281795-Chlamydomonas_euryale.AAC.1
MKPVRGHTAPARSNRGKSSGYVWGLGLGGQAGERSGGWVVFTHKCKGGGKKAHARVVATNERGR